MYLTRLTKLLKSITKSFFCITENNFYEKFKYITEIIFTFKYNKKLKLILRIFDIDI